MFSSGDVCQDLLENALRLLAAPVKPKRILVQITLEVLRRHVMVNAMIATLE